MAGGLIGFLAAFMITAVGGYVYVKKREADVRRGWNLVPVIVAAQDITEGTTITFDHLAQRSVPEQFVTASIVRPDSVQYIANQRVMVPLQAGDPLLWSQFSTADSKTLRACLDAVGEAAEAAKEAAIQQKVRELKEQAATGGH